MILDLPSLSGKVSDLWALTKPRITFLVLLTTAAGLGISPLPLDRSLLIMTLAGTALLVGAANALNMYLERDVDALMERTMDRPLPAKRLSPQIALWMGIFFAICSTVLLFKQVNQLTALLGLTAFISYVLFYTPLKRRSLVALFIGAIPGAIPPLMGWTAATGSISGPGLVLFFILFLWQIPHFLAIALLYKEEYAKGGIRILPLEAGDEETKRWIVRYSIGLVAISLYPNLLGIAGPLYFTVASLTGLLFLWIALSGIKKRALRPWARTLFFASVVYLPVLLISLVIGK
ncbi:MAG: protoheme IX farnesyltransferase [Deltaproteobacteria bacterium]|nr:protoheme IX farnesyltransferase [Deltaproteobacteria bacterium]